jgi:hypothetical protein
VEDDDAENGFKISDIFKSNNPFEKLAGKLKYSGKSMIDEFLRTQKSFKDIGRFAIAYVLLKNESADKLIVDEWCQVLWNKLSYGKNDASDIKPCIAFITFNYDTSLEHIIYAAIRNTFPRCGDEKVKRMFDEMPICHIHGKIKKMPWDNNYKKEMEKYGLSSYEPKDILQMSRGIRLVHEEDNAAEINRVQELISDAQNIVFLGFGFHPENINKLNHDVIRVSPVVVHPSRVHWTTQRRKTTQVTGGEQKIVSVFNDKNLLATGIGISDPQKTSIKNTKGLYALKFIESASIKAFIHDYVDKLL